MRGFGLGGFRRLVPVMRPPCVRCPGTAVIFSEGIGWCRPCAESLEAAQRELLRCEEPNCSRGAEHTCDYPTRVEGQAPGVCLRYICGHHAQKSREGRDVHYCPYHADWVLAGPASSQRGDPNEAAQVRAWLRRQR